MGSGAQRASGRAAAWGVVALAVVAGCGDCGTDPPSSASDMTEADGSLGDGGRPMQPGDGGAVVSDGGDGGLSHEEMGGGEEMGDDGAPPSPQVRCGGGTERCGWRCVDTTHDPLFCGACQVACGLGQVCQQGACADGGTCGAEGCEGLSWCEGATARCQAGCTDNRQCVGDASCDLSIHRCGCAPGELPCGTGCCPAPPTQVIEPDAPAGEATLRFSSQGVPHVSYVVVGDGGRAEALRHAVWVGDRWLRHDVARDLGVGVFANMALDNRDLPHLAYYDAAASVLHHAWFDGARWKREVVDATGSAGAWTALAIAPDGAAWIAYQDADSKDLEIAHRPSGASGWTTQTVDATGDVGSHLALALDPVTHLPWISYRDNTRRHLNVAARQEDGSWQVETVDTGTDVGAWTSIAVDLQGRPHVSYYDLALRDLGYAFRDGATWRRQTVDAPAYVGRDTSLVLDVVGRPRIAYEDISNEKLKLAVWDGAAWAISTLSETHDTGGRDIALTIDHRSRMAIAHPRPVPGRTTRLFYYMISDEP